VRDDEDASGFQQSVDVLQGFLFVLQMREHVDARPPPAPNRLIIFLYSPKPNCFPFSVISMK
jgi:hypothetical protein